MRLDHVDGVRACAALIVYWNHAYAQVSGGDTVQLQGLLYGNRLSMVAGHLCVTIFIVVSGFCLTLPVIRHGGHVRGGVKDFLKRRARRILPPYYAAMFLCLLMIWTIIGKPTGTLWDYPAVVTKQAIIAHLALVQDLFATSHINYVFWSIAVEWHIYFVVPLLVAAWRRFGASAVVLGSLALGYALRIGFSGTRIVRAHPQFLGMFALGMLAAYIARSDEPRFVSLRAKVPWGLVALAAFGVAVALAAHFGVVHPEEHFYILDLPVGLLAMSLLASSSTSEPNALTRVLSWKPLVVIGSFSYSLYLIHAPFLQTMWQYVFTPLGCSRETTFIGLMTGGLLLILVISYLFFLVFEAPFMGTARRKAETETGVIPA